jgi:hypothetical protein
VTSVQSVLSGLPSTSSPTTEPSSLTRLGGSLVDMTRSIDIELDELVVEAKSSEGASGNEQQRNGERDKQAVADLVKKILVCEYTVVSSLALNSPPRLPEFFNQVLAEKGSTLAWFTLPVLVFAGLTGTSAKFERGPAFCWFNSTSCASNHADMLPPATNKTKSTSCENKRKDIANWLRKLPAALARPTHPPRVCLSSLPR